MPDTLEDYIRRFRKLRTDRSAARWPTATRHKAPHKPLLLLAVLDLIHEGAIVENRIALNAELAETFARYWACVPSGYERGRIFYPFFYLRSEGFWHLVARPGKEVILQATRHVGSASQLNTLVEHATLDEQLFVILAIPEARAMARATLVQTYFDTETPERLTAQSIVNARAHQYSKELLAGAGPDRVMELPPSDPYLPAIRDQGFRRAVVIAYDRRCALCGVRILTLEGHTAVDAAHIIPWSVSHDDRPVNGMALCRLCHWAFDEGMVGVTEHYTVLTSPQLGAGVNIPAHLGTLSGRGMIRPPEERYWPDLTALAWHWRELFRSR